MIKNKKKKGGNGKLTSKELQSAILDLFKKNPKKRYNPKQIIGTLGLSNNKDSIQHALEELVKAKLAYPLDDFKYRLDRISKGESGKGGKSLKRKSSRGTGKTMEGVVDLTRSGSGYIICQDLKDDVFVHAKYINGALNGDKVAFTIFRGAKKGRKPEGEILKVIERSSDHFLGQISISKRYANVSPDRNPQMNIFIDLDDINEAKDGEKVVVKIIKWPGKNNTNPIGKVTTVLGVAGSHDIEMKSILINNGFELEFSDQVMEEANALNEEISKEEILKRRDLRLVTTFTIDPDTAKDFDDAISFKKLENDEVEIGVHIADVSHYIQPNTFLDKEALNRSTSVYLVDRVLPMLPEKLSNELCSLRPHEDKLCFSAIFTFNNKSKLISRWFGKTIIHSNRRFTYEEAQEVLETKEGDFAEELLKTNEIAKKLRKQKFKNGAIAFESEEVKFRLDEHGAPIDLYVKERKDAHLLIEDFMLLANKEVSKFVAKKNSVEIPFVYRVHDEPNPEKLANFGLFAKEMGVHLDFQTPKKVAESFNTLSKAAREDETLRILEPIAIRTMAKAEYTTENIGHYGLAFEYYSHFTSPIRRYSDVLTHRILFENLDKIYRVDKEDLEAKCKHISLQERKAMTAERESVKYKQVEYISKFVGKEFEGYVNGIIDRGMFIELKGNKCEGMLGFELFDESFEIADSRLFAKGKRTGTIYKMGDTIKVVILSADLDKRQIEMGLVVED